MTGSREGWWTRWGEMSMEVSGKIGDADDMPAFPFSRADARGVGLRSRRVPGVLRSGWDLSSSPTETSVWGAPLVIAALQS